MPPYLSSLHCTIIGMSDFLYLRVAEWRRGSEYYAQVRPQ
jgi:hypothetical protein